MNLKNGDRIVAALLRRQDYLVFVVARVISVLVKPALLGLMIYQGEDGPANYVSLFYLALSSLMVLLNNEAHFYFYKAKFSEKASSFTIAREEVKYYEGLTLHSLIFSGLVAVFTFLLVGIWWLSVIVFLLILLEKVFDEIQRYLQFAQEFVTWSKIMLTRQLIPFFATVGVLLGGGNSLAVTSTYFLTTLSIFLFQSIQYTEGRQRRIVFKYLSAVRMRSIKGYFGYYRKKLVWNQVQSFSTRNVPLLDRIIVRFVEKDFLAVMSVISQMGSLCILFVDYFLISHRRKEYLEQGRKIFDLASPTKVAVFWAVAVSIFAATVGALYTTGLVVEVNTYWRELIVIGFYYSLYAISQHFVNFNFWNRDRKYTLGVDVIYYLFCAVAFFFVFPDELSLLVRIGGALVLGHTIRLSLQISLAAYSRGNNTVQ